MNRKWFYIIGLGLVLRLIFAYCFTYSTDFRILTLHFKSIATTGTFFFSMNELFKVTGDPQLYGKIWYQLGALWLILLEKLKILSISEISLQTHLQPYQQLGIKLLQIPGDLLALVYMYKISSLLKIRRKFFVVLFWAVNPLWIYITYGMLQADILMIGVLLGVIYAVMREGQMKISTLLLLSFSFVIKLMPLLLVPFIFIYTHKSVRQTAVNCILFVLFAFLWMQPWSPDFLLMRRFGLTSRETTAIFHQQWNGASIFALLYSAFFLFAAAKRRIIRSSPRLFLVMLTAVILIIYLGETFELIFPQFMSWIMPFAAILVADSVGLFPMLLIPFVSFISTAIQDNNFLSGALSDLTGLRLKTNIIQLISRLLQDKFFIIGLRTVFVGLSFFYLYYFFSLLQKKKMILDKSYILMAEKWGVIITIVTYQSYYLFLAVDWLLQQFAR